MRNLTLMIVAALSMSFSLGCGGVQDETPGPEGDLGPGSGETTTTDAQSVEVDSEHRVTAEDEFPQMIVEEEGTLLATLSPREGHTLEIFEETPGLIRFQESVDTRVVDDTGSILDGLPEDATVIDAYLAAAPDASDVPEMLVDANQRWLAAMESAAAEEPVVDAFLSPGQAVLPSEPALATEYATAACGNVASGAAFEAAQCQFGEYPYPNIMGCWLDYGGLQWFTGNISKFSFRVQAADATSEARMRSGWWHWHSGFRAMHLSYGWQNVAPWAIRYQSLWGKFKYWGEAQGLAPCPHFHAVIKAYAR